jgi:hypothetical protein
MVAARGRKGILGCSESKVRDITVVFVKGQERYRNASTFCITGNTFRRWVSMFGFPLPSIDQFACFR